GRPRGGPVRPCGGLLPHEQGPCASKPRRSPTSIDGSLPPFYPNRARL
ncbi:MAG: hypothetical protein AVDCRST_MAG05-412, partial [uncultured Rubrobacteraceae bacterium]